LFNEAGKTKRTINQPISNIHYPPLTDWAMTRVFGRSLNSRDLDTGAAPQRLRTGNPSDPRFFGQLPEEVDANVDAKSAETEIQMAERAADKLLH